MYARSHPSASHSKTNISSLNGLLALPCWSGAPNPWASDPEKDGRIKHFQNARLVNFENAGHWVHHDQLDRFIAEVRSFLADDSDTQTGQ